MKQTAPVNVESARDCTFAGDRLRQERDRLGLSQAELAEIGGTSRRTQISWEQGKGWPAGEYLARTAAAGLDISFVLTGTRTIVELAEQERYLIDVFRRSTDEARFALLGVAEVMAGKVPT